MNARHQRVLAMLREIQRTDGLSARHVEEIAVRQTQPALELAGAGPAGPVPPTGPTAGSVMEAWDRFVRNGPLRPKDYFVLESIVLLGGARPAIDVRQGSFADLPSLWKEINDQRGLLEGLIRGVGRLDLVGHPRLTYGGTAFVCGDRLIMTNRHVAQLFVQGIGDRSQLRFTSGISGGVELKEEVGSSASTRLEVVSPLLILAEWDIAILEVDALPPGVVPLPLARDPLQRADDRLAVIVGYPAFDPVENLAEQLQIFRSVFDKKRLQPGRLKGIRPAQSFGQVVQALGHDCSTLGGNSGSALIDVASARVVGVHFAGQPLVANYAVPTWSLASHPQVASSGVAF